MRWAGYPESAARGRVAALLLLLGVSACSETLYDDYACTTQVVYGIRATAKDG